MSNCVLHLLLIYKQKIFWSNQKNMTIDQHTGMNAYMAQS